LTPEEQKIVARTRKTRKFFVFLRERRHEILGSVLKVEMTVQARGFTALKPEACGLAQAAYLHF
jgi:hypothetical protein